MSYLNSELATYYKEAYEHSKQYVDDVWKLNESLESYLDKINNSEHIRTLYSRSDVSESIDKNSYLAFCYSKNIEEYIETVLIPKLEKEFNNDSVTLKFRKTPPIITKAEPNPNLKYVTDKTYRNVWLYHVLIRGSYDEQYFWQLITNELTSIHE